jgi:hypothetical protein
MNSHSNTQESSFPVGLMMVPALVGALVWVSILVTRLGSF